MNIWITTPTPSTTNMATQYKKDCFESINQQPSVTSQPEEHTPQPDYDFVDQPDQDYFCPVSLELLTQPHQTTCCGNHISQQAADRLIKEGAHCPLCKESNFSTHVDKFFTRKVCQLKICCPNKKSGCKWTGKLGDLNQHTTSCPKRPWKCPYCPFQSTHDIGTTDHAPQCDYQPTPCPNHCQVDTVPHGHIKNHLLTCPLQLVDCEFASAGCDVRVPRKDLAGHMTESAQHHLMTATLLNLQLTRDLHQKMEEKDQQIIQLQTQLQALDAKFQRVDTELQQLDAKTDTNTSEIKKKMEANKVAIHNDLLLLLRGFVCHEITLTEFDQYQEKAYYGNWISTPIKNTPNGNTFTLTVYTNGWNNARGKHLTVHLDKNHNASKTDATAVLQLMNQLGNCGHFIGKEATLSKEDSYGSLGSEYFPLADLDYNAASNTQYLKDNCLKFRLFLKVIVL